MIKQFRVNDKIRTKEVRLIGEEGEQLGIHPLMEAQRIAREHSTDLVEVAPTADPPVCRLMDYGRFRYEQTKKEREARKNSKTILVKEVRLSPKIDEHDLAIKKRTILRLLQNGDKVKVTVRFKGRELAYPQIGKQVLDTVVNSVRGVATPEGGAVMEGRRMNLILARSSSQADDHRSRTPEGPRAQTGREGKS